MDDRFCGQALAAARLFRGFSQSELADSAAVSRQAIANLERGDTPNPTRQTLACLAEALRVPEQFFYSSPGPKPAPGALHFRSRSYVPQRVKSQLLQRAELFGRVVAKLEELAVFQSANFPERTVDSLEDVEAAADACRQSWGLRLDTPIANATRLLERAGAFVATFRGIDSRVDAYCWIDGRRPMVLSTVDKSPSRQRLNLLHEAGHLVLHGGCASGDERTEREAFRFATSVLLPRVAMFREFPRGNRLDWPAIIAMKKRWGVSVQAISRHGRDLGLLTERQYKSAAIHIQQQGWRSSEPAEPDEHEHPELTLNVVESLRASGSDISTIVAGVGLSVPLFEEISGVRIKPGGGTVLSFAARRAPGRDHPAPE